VSHWYARAMATFIAPAPAQFVSCRCREGQSKALTLSIILGGVLRRSAAEIQGQVVREIDSGTIENVCGNER
jgi:hypothetical protein